MPVVISLGVTAGQAARLPSGVPRRFVAQVMVIICASYFADQGRKKREAAGAQASLGNSSVSSLSGEPVV